ncbi:MAG: hypothetical protein E6Q68_03650 [Polynucleobacter sp.]|nr:MAG: hypothetical protein E6Q68_03650 [Polynucleobacter sp.]
MSLYVDLQKAKTEEDVKDAYVKALGLKSYSKNLIDIQTEEIWFEAKDAPHSPYAMFTQLLHYVHFALNKGDHIPPILAVIDNEKAALMRTKDVMDLFKDKDIKWGKSASQFSKETLERVSTYIGTHFVAFKIETHEKEFIEATKTAVKNGEFLRIKITPDNLRQVFDKWVDLIGCEIEGALEADYAVLFFADIMHDGKTATHENLPARLLHDGEKPVFLFDGKSYELSSINGYRQFWAIYHKPPEEEYRNYLLERRDSLLPLDERSFKGAFYTPLKVVDKAYDLLNETLEANWQKNYIVWDMCCGVGNLETKHSNHRNIYMSTLDKADIDVMKASRTCVSANRFQYDYLNDDIDDFGQIDYTLTNKVPLELQKAIAEGKKILVLINPPYAEAANDDNTSAAGENAGTKAGVSKTKVASIMDAQGYAARELFVQFLVRISKEMPTATVAVFSKLKYITAPNFELFRKTWNAKYMNGFVVHSKAFEGLKGDFPIGFLIWKQAQLTKERHEIEQISAKVLTKEVTQIGEKNFYNIASEKLLSNWICRAKSNSIDALPLKNAISPTTSTKDVRGTKWADNAIGGMICKGSDLQNASTQTALLSSGYCSAGGLFVTKENLWQAAVVFAVRRLIKPTWLNDRDQFLIPDKELTEDFKNDCLIWMLFNGSNLSAGADDLEWNGKKWSLVNHFIPFTEDEVNAVSRFESRFMVDYLNDKPLSIEAKEVMGEGRVLWRTFFSTTDEKTIRDEFKLNRSDVGWYQVRKALEARNKSGNYLPIDFSSFKKAYDDLTEKLIPQVYEFGFLK